MHRERPGRGGENALVQVLGSLLGGDRMSEFEGDGGPDIGTPEEQLARRNRLFEQLRNIDPETVLALAKEYSRVFPKHPGGNDVDVISMLSGASLLDNLEAYIFDLDRMVAMCKAVQDAVRQVATMTDGPIKVLEAGYGLGYVAMAALALNEELDNRVRVIGLELNAPTLHRASQMVDYYGIDHDWVDLQRCDATKVGDLPDDIHILVAEHFNQGVFSQEPLSEVHLNLIPQLAEPFFVIPAGVDIYGRVVDENTQATSDQVRDVVGRAVRKMKKVPFRIIEEDQMDSMSRGLNRELIEGQLLARIQFADLLDGAKWCGRLDLNISGAPERSGTGIAQLQSVPTFHNDPQGAPVLESRRMYVYGNTIAYGTSLNQWCHVRDEARLQELFDAFPGDDNMALSMAVTYDPQISPRIRLNAGQPCEISIQGVIDQLGARVSCVGGGISAFPPFHFGDEGLATVGRGDRALEEKKKKKNRVKKKKLDKKKKKDRKKTKKKKKKR